MHGGLAINGIRRPPTPKKKGRYDRGRTAQGGHAIARGIGEETGHRRTGSVIAKLGETSYKKVNKTVLNTSFLRIFINVTNPRLSNA